MELRSEFYDFLGITGIFIELEGGDTVMATTDFIDLKKIRIKPSGEITSNNVNVKFVLKTGGEEKIACTIEKDYSNSDCYYCNYTSPVPDAIKDKIMEFTNINQISDKRAEIRYPIGIENWKIFGLKTVDVSFVLDDKITRSVINNVSYHGCLLTGERSSTRIGSVVTFYADTKEGYIAQKANLVQVEKVAENYFRYRFNFISPISLKWIKLVKNFSEIDVSKTS